MPADIERKQIYIQRNEAIYMDDEKTEVLVPAGSVSVDASSTGKAEFWYREYSERGTQTIGTVMCFTAAELRELADMQDRWANG